MGNAVVGRALNLVQDIVELQKLSAIAEDDMVFSHGGFDPTATGL